MKDIYILYRCRDTDGLLPFL